MEYIDGVTLKEYIEHTGVLPWKDAVHFTIQILHALQHAHDKGIVHRDIKPQNIMLLRSGEIKVTDFGIARFARSESRTISDRAIGSVHYISPEQAMGEYTDEKSDIYSTGIMLYEMITGRLPFQADSAVSVAMKQIQSPIQNPRSVNPSIPPALEEITLRAVQKDPRYRFQSAAEMISALEQVRLNPQTSFGYTLASDTQEIEKNPKSRRTKSTVNASRNKKEKPKKKQKRGTPYVRMLMVVTLAVVIGSAGFIGIMLWLNNPFVKTDEAVLPNFVGQTTEEIQSLYPNYVFEEAGTEYNDDYNKGAVFEQKPRAGSSVKVGSTVKIWVSEGRKSITIPEDIMEMPAARAMNLLREMGLEPTQERMNHDTVAAGRVIDSDPKPGTVLSGGDSINLYVSEGPKIVRVTVPDLTGIPIDVAMQQLREVGFEVGTTTKQSSDLPEGTVISHFPQPGSFEVQGTQVNFIVSEGGLTKWSLAIPLPTNMDREVTIRARVGEGDTPAVAAEDFFNPSQSATGIWNPAFAGKEGEKIKIVIYIDGLLYQEYYLDFTDGSHEMTKDRSTAAEFQQ